MHPMLTLEVNPADLVTGVALYGRQLPYAAMLALNRSDEEVQTRLQQELHRQFTLRTPSSTRYLERMLKIKREDRATKTNPVARLRIEAAGDLRGELGLDQQTALLTRHITGGTHTLPGGPLSSFFIPADALRPAKSAVVPRALYPKNLRLMDRKGVTGMLYAKRRVTSGGKVQIIGKQRTFVLMEPGTDRPYGVYQREGPHDIQLLWLYTRRVRLPARYDFYGIARRTFLERWPINMRAFWDVATRTATRL